MFECCKVYGFVDGLYLYVCDVDYRVYDTYVECMENCGRSVWGARIHLSLGAMEFLLGLVGLLIGFFIVYAMLKAIQ